MTELEELEQKVADTKAAYAYAYANTCAAIDHADAANANYVRAKKKLATYLKEQDNNG